MKEKQIFDLEKLNSLSAVTEPESGRQKEILEKARELKGLSIAEAAELLSCTGEKAVQELLETAAYVKERIYGPRMVLFAPVYAGNKCCNDCLYCGFRSSNRDLHRTTLSMSQIENETLKLLRQGHKRVLFLTGESREYDIDYTLKAIESIYRVTDEKGSSIRRVNVEIAPLSTEEFRKLKSGNIGTYTCFQETYDPELYAKYHPKGPKADYRYRLEVMDRAMSAGIDDVGVGVLFGLAPYQREVLSVLMHGKYLERTYGCGPHTVSVPRLEPAEGAPLTRNIPYPVIDEEFKKIIAVIRLTLPYTGIILSTRETAELRSELFTYGVSQVSAGSRTNPGGYGEEDTSHSQFSLGDHRSLSEVITDLTANSLVPSFCTGCYRMGRTGNDFMDLAKPGLIKKFCLPNGISSFAEYLEDYAPMQLKKDGYALIEQIAGKEGELLSRMIRHNVQEVASGARDLYV